MDEKVVIAKRVALEMKEGSLVNLGIGLPTTVATYLPAGLQVFFQSENGIIGMQPLPDKGLVNEDLTDAGGSPIGEPDRRGRRLCRRHSRRGQH